MTHCTDMKLICADYAYRSKQVSLSAELINAFVSFSCVHEKEFAFYLHC